MGCCSDKGPWTQDPLDGSCDWDDRHRRRLVDHEAVANHGKGVDPEQLADFIHRMSALAASRVTGTGADQYGGEIQAFERKSIHDLRWDILEEVADVIAYAAMIAIKTLDAR